MEWLEGERDECLEGSLGSAGSSLGDSSLYFYLNFSDFLHFLTC